MNKILLPTIFAVLVLAGCGNSNSANTPSSKTGSALTSSQSLPQKFADQPYATSAYLISSDPLSPAAQTAISGFQMTKQSNPDGTTLVTLKALEPQYHDQQYTLRPGDQLYFIDKFMADDLQNKEVNPNDDAAVVVDSQGNIVEGPSNFAP